MSSTQTAELFPRALKSLGLKNEPQTRRKFLSDLACGIGREGLKKADPFLPLPEHADNEAIVYYGPSQIEIDGKKYNVAVDGKAFVELAYEMAKRNGDSELLGKLHDYFKTSHVNVNIYNLASNPVPSLMLAGAYFRAPFLDLFGKGDSEIGISPK